MKKSLLFPIAAIGWVIFCTILLTLPGDDFPSDNWMDRIYFDKWVHIGLFAIMAFLFCHTWYSYSSSTASTAGLVRGFIGAGLACVAYGIIMELVQRYCTADRSFDLWDILADMVGSVIGAVFSARRLIKK